MQFITATTSSLSSTPSTFSTFWMMSKSSRAFARNDRFYTKVYVSSMCRFKLRRPPMKSLSSLDGIACCFANGHIYRPCLQLSLDQHLSALRQPELLLVVKCRQHQNYTSPVTNGLNSFPSVLLRMNSTHTYVDYDALRLVFLLAYPSPKFCCRYFCSRYDLQLCFHPPYNGVAVGIGLASAFALGYGAMGFGMLHQQKKQGFRK